MSAWPQEPESGHGLVLLSGSLAGAERALRRGLVAVHAVALPGWTGVCLAESRARSAAPYDAGLEVLAARPVRRGQRAAVGFFVIDGCAVLTVHPRGLRAQQRWLVWQPGVGVRATPDLPPLSVSMLVDAVGAGERVDAATLQSALDDPSGTPLELLITMLRLLGLPGEHLLVTGGSPDLPTIEPSERAVRAFDALIYADEVGAAGVAAAPVTDVVAGLDEGSP